MQTVFDRLGKQRWAAFLLYQLVIFGIAFGFLTIVRRLTGRSIHLGQDPIGVTDGIALAVLSIGVIFLTNWFYQRIKKTSDAPPLGIGLSVRRSLDLIIGLILALTFFITPWLVAVWRETASISDRVWSHFDTTSMIAILSAAFLLLLLQAVMEETANRAFPMQLWHDRSIFFRLLVPAIFFVLIHLISEPFDVQRAAILLMAGVIHGLAFVLTGNVWLTSGLHFGANVASYSVSGLWHAGAIVNIVGDPAIPVWGTTLISLVLLSVLVFRTNQLKSRSASS